MSVNTPSFISSLKKYRDGFRGYVVVNYILLVITPFLVIMSLFLIYYMRTSLNSYCENTLKLIESEQERLNEISSTLIEESMFPYYGNYLDDLNIPGEYGERIDDLVQESMDRELSLRTDVDEIIMSYGGRTITAGQNFRNVYGTLNSYDEVLEKSGGRPLWITALEAQPRIKSGYLMVLGRTLNSSILKNVGKLYLLVDIKTTDEILGDLSDGNSETYLVNPDLYILNSSDKEKIGTKFEYMDLDLSGKEGFRYSNTGKLSMVMYNRSYRTGWTLIHIVPVMDILQGFNIVIIAAIFVAVIYLIFLVSMYHGVNQKILIPIDKLKNNVDEFAQGNMLVQADINEAGEVGKLNRHFNSMTQQIHELMLKNKQEEREKNDFKMKALVAQLSPHFLYNALNTIRWMSVINKQNNIRDLTEALIKILMTTAQSGQDYYTVENEIDLIKSYAVLQKARFMNFSINYDIDKEAEHCKIRRFLVQPIVENSIIHGFSRGNMTNGKIWIKIWTDDSLHITVKDNGCGFDVDQLKMMTDHGNDEISHISLAIQNIEQIIKIDYGEEYGMQIKSEAGQGTVVDYVLPVMRSECDDTDNISR